MDKEDVKNELYRIVAEELSNSNIDQGLWLRALVESENNHDMAKANYTKLRIEQLSRDIKNLQASENENAKNEKARNEQEKENHKELKKILEQASKRQKWQNKR